MSDRIPGRFRADVIRHIGQGGEATVYELTGDRVLRVYHGVPHGVSEIASFYRAIARGNTSFALPEIIEQGADAGVFYSLDRLIPGRPLHELMPQLTGDERARVLASYTDAAFEIASLPVVGDEYGEFLRNADSIRAANWNTYLLARMRHSLEASPWLGAAVPELDTLVTELTRRIEEMPPKQKALVHGDYFPGNVLIADDLTVSGVIDFGPLTVIGDPWLDLASTAIFLGVVPGHTPEDEVVVRSRLASRVGSEILGAITLYRGWYAIRFSPYRDDDPNLYAWCVASLHAIGRELGV